MSCRVVSYSSYFYLLYFTHLVIFVFLSYFLLSCLLFIIIIILIFYFNFIMFYFCILFIIFFLLLLLGSRPIFGLNLGPNWLARPACFLLSLPFGSFPRRHPLACSAFLFSFPRELPSHMGLKPARHGLLVQAPFCFPTHLLFFCLPYVKQVAEAARRKASPHIKAIPPRDVGFSQ